jgi:hypothetical protein
MKTTEGGGQDFRNGDRPKLAGGVRVHPNVQVTPESGGIIEVGSKWAQIHFGLV